MKLKITIAILMVSCLSLFSLKGQESGFDVEKHRKERADFFIKELNLTEKEQKEFIPLMQEYFYSRYKLNKQVRDAGRELKEKKEKTDQQCQLLINLIVSTKIEEAQLQKEYYQKFGKVLSPEQILRYHKAEMDFMQKAVKHHHQGKGKMQEKK